MSGLFIYTSNYLEKLSEKLADVVLMPLENPLTPEIICVHSKGMERWVSMELARRNGICANVWYPFPDALMRRLFEIVQPDLMQADFFNPEIMTFAVMKHLLENKSRESFPEIKRYLANNDHELKLFQLCEKLARTFDRYVIFRPDMILRWDEGKEDHWQARLWRMISSGQGQMHPAGLQKKFIQHIASTPAAADGLPKRVSVFGTSYLPPFYLEALAVASRLIDVHFFIMNPCREYWGDILTENQAVKIQRHYGGGDNLEKDLFLIRGNPLLSSMGALGKEFFKSIAGIEGVETDLFCDPEADTILSRIQSDILNLRDRTRENRPADSERSGDEDCSRKIGISIHSCHSPMREIEVLHDQLLAMLEEDPALVPGDIVVMTPDIDGYAPFIKAVFGAQTDERLRIPFSIADQGNQGGHPVISCFWSMLDLVGSRMDVTSVMGILQFHGVKEKFELDETDILLIEQWLKDTNVRWGIDAAHRKHIGLPGFGENTWKSGTDRLLLGYAMPSDSIRLFSGILAYDSIEGEHAEVLGKFLEFKTRLFNAIENLSEKKTPGGWASRLTHLMDEFFSADESMEIEKQILGRTFDFLANLSKVYGFDQEIGLPEIRFWLRNHLANQKGGGFISRGTTFCAMLPFRSIPAKIICLIGMNSNAFPRDHRLAGFDLMAAHPRPGDRNGRNEDKYLFLQALLSAREKFYISFVGQSNRDNTGIPPSVLVQDLIDYSVKGFGVSEASIMVKHRLQPFSEAYFDGKGPLFSYSQEDFDACQAARDRAGSQQKERIFLEQPLSPPDEAFYTMDIDELGFFLSNPCKYLLNRRLRLYLDDELWNFEEREVFTLDGLEQYQIGQDLVRMPFKELNFEDLHAIQRAMGRIPHGVPGEVAFSEIFADASAFNERVFSRKQGQNPETLDIQLKIDDFTLSGVLTELYEEELLQIEYVNIKPKYLIRAWIRHLVLCAMGETGFSERTVLIGRDSTWIFSSVQNSKEILKTLLSLYREGLRMPLAFFPETSYIYASRLFLSRKTEPELLKDVLEKWRGNDFTAGESENPYFRLCFPPGRFMQIIAEKAFQETARQVFSPLLSHCRKFKEG